MRIDLHKLPKNVHVTEIDVQRWHDDLNDWAEIEKMTSTRGWKIFITQLQEELKQNDTLRTIDPNLNKFLIQKGYCNGLRKPLQIIEKIRKTATTASENLEVLAKGVPNE